MYSNIDPNSYWSVSRPRLSAHRRQIQKSAHLPVLAYLTKNLIEGGPLPWIVKSNFILPLGFLRLALTKEQEEEEEEQEEDICTINILATVQKSEATVCI